MLRRIIACCVARRTLDRMYGAERKLDVLGEQIHSANVRIGEMELNNSY